MCSEFRVEGLFYGKAFRFRLLSAMFKPWGFNLCAPFAGEEKAKLGSAEQALTPGANGRAKSWSTSECPPAIGPGGPGVQGNRWCLRLGFSAYFEYREQSSVSHRLPTM